MQTAQMKNLLYLLIAFTCFAILSRLPVKEVSPLDQSVKELEELAERGKRSNEYLEKHYNIK